MAGAPYFPLGVVLDNTPQVSTYRGQGDEPKRRAYDPRRFTLVNYLRTGAFRDIFRRADFDAAAFTSFASGRPDVSDYRISERGADDAKSYADKIIQEFAPRFPFSLFVLSRKIRLPNKELVFTVGYSRKRLVFVPD